MIESIGWIALGVVVALLASLLIVGAVGLISQHMKRKWHLEVLERGFDPRVEALVLERRFNEATALQDQLTEEAKRDFEAVKMASVGRAMQKRKVIKA